MSMLDSLLGLMKVLLNGASVASRRTLNFTGGVTVVDNPTEDRLDINIAGGGVGVGDVVGPGASVNSRVATFSGTTGKLIQDGGQTIAQIIAAAPQGTFIGPGSSIAHHLVGFTGTTGQLGEDSGILASDVATHTDVAAAVAGISSWKTALDLNLYSDANFTFVNGANTWHGVTWTGKNIASAADIFAVQNGVGLVIDPNAVASEWFVANDTYPAIYARLLDLIPGYVPGQTRVRTRAMWTVTNSNAAYEYAGFAIERLPFVASQRLHWGCMQGYDPAHAGGTGYDCMQRTIRAASAAQRHSNVAKNAQMLDLQGAQLANFYKANIAAPATDPNSTAIPTSIFSLTAEWSYSQQATLNGGFTTATDADGRVVPYASDPGDLCLVLGAQTGNTTNSFSATFTRLIVEYKL